MGWTMPERARCRYSGLIDGMPDPRKWVRVYEVVRRRIGSGEYPPGSALPPFAVLAAELGVGRDTVQHAYKQLAADGLAERYPGLGYFVSDET
jgi:DNA-binding GntR family transcriptional regulator